MQQLEEEMDRLERGSVHVCLYERENEMGIWEGKPHLDCVYF